MKFDRRIFLAASICLALNVSAQTRTTPEVCYKRCTTLAFEEPELMEERFRAKLMKIQAKKKEETDPEKIKELEVAEKNELERMKESLERMCNKMCSFKD